MVTLTHYGYVKRTPLSTYRTQRRGGRGITGLATREEDFVKDLFITSTHQRLLFFTSRGKAYELKAYEIPEAGRNAKGTAIINLLQLEPGERVEAFIPIKEKHFEKDLYLFMATRNGLVKKTPIRDFANMRKSGLIAITLREDDELIRVILTDGNQEIIMATRYGQSIRYHEGDVRAMGRTAMGVKSMDLQDGDFVIDMERLIKDADVLSISENGYGKRTHESEYRCQHRGGRGIKTMNITEKTGNLSALKVVTGEEDLVIINSEGVIIRIDTDEISTMGRNTQGVTLMRMEDNYIVSVAKAKKEEEEIPEEEEMLSMERCRQLKTTARSNSAFSDDKTEHNSILSEEREDTSLERLLERAEGPEDEKDN